MVDENLSQDADNGDERKLKDPDYILENRDIDNRYREEHENIMLLANRQPNNVQEAEEKYQVEQLVKEENVAVRILVNVDSERNANNGQPPSADEVDAAIKVAEPAGGYVAATAKNFEVLADQLNKIMKQDGTDKSDGRQSPKASLQQALNQNVGGGFPEEVLQNVKDALLLREKESGDRRFSKTRFSQPDPKDWKGLSEKPPVPARKDSVPMVDDVNNDHMPDHMISRAAITFAVMQDDKTHTAADEADDVNATRAAPFTVASQWGGGFGSESNSDADDESEGEDGADFNKKISSRKKRAMMNTLADEDDLRMDSVMRSSLIIHDGDQINDLRNHHAMRGSLVLLDDDNNDSAIKDLNDSPYHIGERKLSSSSLTKVPISSESRVTVVEKSQSLDNLQSRTGILKMPDKIAKEIGNIMSPLNSPSKSMFKTKDSLTDMKKLSSLGQVKASIGKPPTPQTIMSAKWDKFSDSGMNDKGVHIGKIPIVEIVAKRPDGPIVALQKSRLLALQTDSSVQNSTDTHKEKSQWKENLKIDNIIKSPHKSVSLERKSTSVDIVHPSKTKMSTIPEDQNSDTNKSSGHKSSAEQKQTNKSTASDQSTLHKDTKEDKSPSSQDSSHKISQNNVSSSIKRESAIPIPTHRNTTPRKESPRRESPYRESTTLKKEVNNYNKKESSVSRKDSFRESTLSRKDSIKDSISNSVKKDPIINTKKDNLNHHTHRHDPLKKTNSLTNNTSSQTGSIRKENSTTQTNVKNDHNSSANKTDSPNSSQIRRPTKRRSSSASRVSDRTTHELREALKSNISTPEPPPQDDPDSSRVPKPPPGLAPKNAVTYAR